MIRPVTRRMFTAVLAGAASGLPLSGANGMSRRNNSYLIETFRPPRVPGGCLKSGSDAIVLEAAIGPHIPEILAIRRYAGRNRASVNQSVFVPLTADSNGPEFVIPQPVSWKYLELRVYHLSSDLSSPSLLDRFHQGLASRNGGIFARSGITPILFGNSGDARRLGYLIPFDTLAARERAWAFVNADPDWHKLREESNTSGHSAAVSAVSIYVPVANSFVD